MRKAIKVDNSERSEGENLFKKETQCSVNHFFICLIFFTPRSLSFCVPEGHKNREEMLDKSRRNLNQFSFPFF